MPDFTTKGFEPHVVALEALGFVHLGTPFEPAVEFETPVMIRTQKDPRMSTARFSLRGISWAVSIVAEARWHNVHRAVWTHPREDPDFAILAVNNDERFAEDIEINEIPRLRNLGLVGETHPTRAKDMTHLPIEELGTCVRGRRECATALKRDVSGCLDIA